MTIPRTPSRKRERTRSGQRPEGWREGGKEGGRDKFGYCQLPIEDQEEARGPRR